MKQTFTLSVFYLLLLTLTFNVHAQLEPPYGTCDAVAGPYTPDEAAPTDTVGNYVYLITDENPWQYYIKIPTGGTYANNAFVFDAIKYDGNTPVDTALVVSNDYTIDVEQLGLTVGDVLHVYSFTYNAETINFLAIYFYEQCAVIEQIIGNDQVCEILSELQDNGGIQTLEDVFNLVNLFECKITDANKAAFCLDSLYQALISPFPIPQQTDDKLCFAYDGYTEISIVLSVNNQSIKTSSVNIYPNPSNNFIYVDLNGKAAISKIEVYDANGQLHLLGFNQRLDISSLPLGVYTLHVQTVDNQLYQNRFVKTE